MEKQSKTVNKSTLKTINKMYEKLTMLEYARHELHHTNYDQTDEVIDNNIYKIKELLDDMYENCIQKKCGFSIEPITVDLDEAITPVKSHVFSTCTPPPAPRKNILNEILDYSSDDNSLSLDSYPDNSCNEQDTSSEEYNVDSCASDMSTDTEESYEIDDTSDTEEDTTPHMGESEDSTDEEYCDMETETDTDDEGEEGEQMYCSRCSAEI